MASIEQILKDDEESLENAAKIIEITKEFISDDRLKDFFNRLQSEVKTNNNYLRLVLNRLKGMINPPVELPPKWLLPSFYLLVVVHYILVVGVALSFVLLPFLTEWFIALPLMLFIVFFTTNNVECKLTVLENKMRKRLGKKQIGGFVGHYFKKPFRNLIKRFKR